MRRPAEGYAEWLQRFQELSDKLPPDPRVTRLCAALTEACVPYRHELGMIFFETEDGTEVCLSPRVFGESWEVEVLRGTSD